MFEFQKQDDEYLIIKSSKILRVFKSKENAYNYTSKFIHHLIKAFKLKSYFCLLGTFFLYDPTKKIDTRDMFITLDENKYKINRVISIHLLNLNIIFYFSKIPYETLLNLEIHTKLFLKFRDCNGYGLTKGLHYKAYDFKKGKFRRSKIKIIPESNTALYIRQSAKNNIYLTHRIINKTDFPFEQFKIYIAAIISLFLTNNKILLYEKESAKYEESASVLFEKLIDMNKKNIHYVLEEKEIERNSIKAKYKKYIIKKHSFSHYINVFRSKYLISTEAPAHVVDLRTSSKTILKFLRREQFGFIFLQHGVMYMVSLSAKTRVPFQKGGIFPNRTKIVISSQLEMEHFIQHGNYKETNLYLTGLPKFDVSCRFTNADKIVIMPTWRPWEYNVIRTNLKETEYYNLIISILKSIPYELLNKTILLPHPLFKDSFSNSNLAKFMKPEFSYNEILKDTDVLITDYSSIAFDAFYRGSKIIFYWRDKDYCMENYGGELMLNESISFGDICYNEIAITKSLKNIYKQPQEEHYIKNYRKIVEFNDNNNTIRLIQFLERDKII